MLDLVRGNLSALRSDKSALGLLAVGALVLAVAATLGAFGAFPLFFVIGFVLVPIFGTAIGAVQVSGERASGYAAVLHTAPITPAAYYAAKWLTAFLWTSLAIALTLPYGLLFALFLGPAFLAEFLPWVPVGLLLAAFSASLGLLLSVLVGRRGLLPSAFAGVGIALAVALVPLLLQALPDAMRDAVGWMTRLSPLVDVLDPRQGLSARTLDEAEGWIGYGLVATYAVLYGLLGFVMYARLQSAEGWDARGSHVAAVLGAGLLLVLAPVALVGGNPLERPTEQPQLSPAFSVSAHFLEPGEAMPTQEQLQRGEPIGFRETRFVPGEPRALQVVFAGRPHRNEPELPRQEGPPPPDLTNVVLRLEGGNGYRAAVVPTEVRLDRWEARPCGFTVPAEGDQPAREVMLTGCYEFAPQAFAFTVTVTSVPAFRDGPGGALLRLHVASDQGTFTTFQGGNLVVDTPEFPWWATFAVWLLVVGAFALLQAQRLRHLGRKQGSAQVVRRAPARPRA